MADETPEVQNGEQPEKKGSMVKFIIIGVVALVLVAGGFFGLKMFMGGDEEEEANGGKAKPAATEPPPAEVEAPGAMVEIPSFIVNLADPGGKRYLKLSISMDIGTDEATKARVDQVMPRIRDSLLLLLSSKNYSDISTVAGKVRLRNEVLKIVNRALAGTQGVHAVYFTEFVIQ
jgi:flagellar FliL protein